MTAKTAYLRARMQLDGHPIDILRGDTVYLIRTTLEDGRSWTEASRICGTKNMSHQNCERGWLGNTNGVNEQALGRAVVVRVGAEEHDGHDTLRNVDVAPYLNVTVKMAPNAHDTFERDRDRNIGRITT